MHAHAHTYTVRYMIIINGYFYGATNYPSMGSLAAYTMALKIEKHSKNATDIN